MGRITKTVRGFTLVELTIVVVIIGVLAAFAVPKVMNAVERSKAGEAFNYLSTVQTAQEGYRARQGSYASAMATLEMDLPVLANFETAGMDKSDPQTLQTTWTMTLRRKGAAAGFGAYTVVFNQDGFNSKASTIGALPEINPLQPHAGD